MTTATQRLRARAALLWERAAPVLAAPAAALAIYAGLALLGVFERVGDPWRALALIAAVAAAAALSWRPSKAFRWPVARDVERRLEADSGLDARPFEALRDAPAAGDDGLWSLHRERMEQLAKSARARRPKAAWARLDPFGLRVGAVLVLAVAWLSAGDLAGLRLVEAFSARPMQGGGARAIVDLWIDPPDYTGRAPIFLSGRDAAEAPEGSVFKARVAGFQGRPRLSGLQAEPERLDDATTLLTARLEASTSVTISAGVTRRSADIAVVPDEPPSVSLAAEPEGDRNGVMTLPFKARDDYGIEAYALEIAALPDDAPGDAAPGADAVWDALPVSPGAVTPGAEDGERSARIDVAKHPLAGERVFIRLAAIDGAGQRGVSGPMAIVLPSRVFLDPLARAVAHERKGFIAAEADYAAMPDDAPAGTVAGPDGFLDDEPARRIERAPAGVRRAALALDAISDAPPAYFDDAVVYLGLRTAMHQVRRAREIEALAALPDDLWRIALRAELGSLADAEEALRAAEQAIADALARGAPQSEMSPLFDAYEEAVRNYMNALAREAAEAGRFAQGGGGGGMNQDALQELIEALREAAELGQGEEAQRALAALAELLRNMQVQLSRGGSGSGQMMDEATRRALEELGDLIGEQRGVMDETFRQGEGSSGGSQSGAQGAEGGQGGEEGGEEGGEDGIGAGGEEREDGAGGSFAERQRELAERLEALRGTLGDQAGEALGEAGQAMAEAERALRDGDGEGALGAQQRALDQLREGAADAARSMLAQDGEGGGRDPLGRDGSGNALGGGVDVPSESERQRARDILEELRRRAGERGRSEDELDYIERLLERF